MMKKVMVLGSTGSIGVNSLSVIDHYKAHFKVDSLAANRNISLLEQQVQYNKPDSIYIENHENRDYLRNKFPEIKIYCGRRELENFIINSEADMVISAISGFAGLLPTFLSVKHKKGSIALANKESLVCAGELLMNTAKTNNINIIPVDSEHSTIFKLLESHRHDDISKIVLTASGGPFLNLSRRDLESVGIEDALNHPRWKMGKKISIDSATMANKVLEIIEAHYFFEFPYAMIDVVIHPQSMVHSLIKTKENTFFAELGPADMRIPIANALFYPKSFENSILDFDLHEMEALTFEKPSYDRFPLLKYKSLLESNSNSKNMQIYHIAFNASNEEAVNAFLNGAVAFNMIDGIVLDTLETVSEPCPSDIDEVFYYDSLFRKRANKIIKRIHK